MDEPVTPDAQLSPDAAGIPATEQAPAAAAEDGADQSAAPVTIGQAEYTRSTQMNAAIRKELGLPKSATQADVVAALSALKAGPPAAADEDDQDEDPRLTAERERRITAELRVKSAVYGEDFTKDAVDLMNLARTSDDYDEIIDQLAAFRDKHGSALVAQAAADEAPPASTAPEQSIGTSEGDRAPSLPTSPTPSGRQESGTIAAVRGLFAAAGAASRPDN